MRDSDSRTAYIRATARAQEEILTLNTDAAVRVCAEDLLTIKPGDILCVRTRDYQGDLLVLTPGERMRASDFTDVDYDFDFDAYTFDVLNLSHNESHKFWIREDLTYLEEIIYVYPRCE